jgi:hypothetical protein
VRRGRDRRHGRRGATAWPTLDRLAWYRASWHSFPRRVLEHKAPLVFEGQEPGPRRTGIRADAPVVPELFAELKDPPASPRHCPGGLPRTTSASRTRALCSPSSRSTWRPRTRSRRAGCSSAHATVSPKQSRRQHCTGRRSAAAGCGASRAVRDQIRIDRRLAEDEVAPVTLRDREAVERSRAGSYDCPRRGGRRRRGPS